MMKIKQKYHKNYPWQFVSFCIVSKYLLFFHKTFDILTIKKMLPQEKVEKIILEK